MAHPTPWRIDESGWIVDASGENVTGVYDFDVVIGDLAFIVRCVNSHDALVAALRSLRNEANGLIGFVGDKNLREVVGTANANCIRRRLDEADAVLAQAEATHD